MNDELPSGVLPGTDNRGRAIVRVPLGNRPGAYATVEAEDFTRLVQAGLSAHWFAVKDGGGLEYVRVRATGASGGQITLARAILGLGRRQSVSFLSQDRFDLRRANLITKRGNGSRNDAQVYAQARAERGAA